MEQLDLEPRKRSYGANRSGNALPGTNSALTTLNQCRAEDARFSECRGLEATEQSPNRIGTPDV